MQKGRKQGAIQKQKKIQSEQKSNRKQQISDLLKWRKQGTIQKQKKIQSEQKSNTKATNRRFAKIEKRAIQKQ